MLGRKGGDSDTKEEKKLEVREATPCVGMIRRRSFMEVRTYTQDARVTSLAWSLPIVVMFAPQLQYYDMRMFHVLIGEWGKVH